MKRFHVFSRVTCVEHFRCAGMASEAEFVEAFGEDADMLTSPMYSRANLLDKCLRSCTHPWRARLSCAAIRHCYQIDGTFLGLCADRDRGHGFTWRKRRNAHEYFNIKHTSNILQNNFKTRVNILKYIL